MSVELLPQVAFAEDKSICRLINGGWQWADGHSSQPVDRGLRLAELERLLEQGAVTFDCADIYTGVEELLGELLAGCSSSVRSMVRVHTKFVPDLATLPNLNKADVESVIDRSMRRLGVAQIDLVQFHWWDYGVERYVLVAGWLEELRKAGKIADLGVTNFDSPRLEMLLQSGVRVRSNQVQYSLLDRRVAKTLEPLCQQHEVALFCYGALAGGFLSDSWLHRPRPLVQDLENRSLVKYLLVIEEFGGWELFQELLEQLQEIAAKHSADLGVELGLATVALRWVLERPGVSAVIVGQRSAERLRQNRLAFSFALDDEDERLLERVLSQSVGPSGPVYALERDREGPHGAIMKYDLNDAP